MNFAGLPLVLVGIVSLIGTICDLNWYMESRKARFMVDRLGRNKARIFYGVLSSIVGALGVLIMTNVIKV